MLRSTTAAADNQGGTKMAKKDRTYMLRKGNDEIVFKHRAEFSDIRIEERNADGRGGCLFWRDRSTAEARNEWRARVSNGFIRVR